MAKTLLLTLGFVTSGLSVFSYIYYSNKKEKGIQADNLFYNMGAFLESIWFPFDKIPTSQ